MMLFRVNKKSIGRCSWKTSGFADPIKQRPQMADVRPKIGLSKEPYQRGLPEHHKHCQAYYEELDLACGHAHALLLPRPRSTKGLAFA